MNNISIYDFNNMPAGDLADIDKQMHALGVMRNIYVPVCLEVLETKKKLGSVAGRITKMFENPHQKKQDAMHKAFFDDYLNWSQKAVNIRSCDFPFRYPTNGSNEAIRETIAYHANNERFAGKTPRIHIFTGEYEGYKAHANTHQAEVVEHDRDNYEESFTQHIKPGDPFYLSAPSGIDGNVWPEYDNFLVFLENKFPQVRLMLDLAYINTTTNTPSIRTDSESIEAIFISMSKSFPGTYYDRIGGVISKKDIPGLYGNIWFKNLNGLLLGYNLMKNFPLGHIPNNMKKYQQLVVDTLNLKICGGTIEPSDVTFVATQELPEKPTVIQKELVRANRVRYCLTPGITNLQKT